MLLVPSGTEFCMSYSNRCMTTDSAPTWILEVHRWEPELHLGDTNGYSWCNFTLYFAAAQSLGIGSCLNGMHPTFLGKSCWRPWACLALTDNSLTVSEVSRISFGNHWYGHKVLCWANNSIYRIHWIMTIGLMGNTERGARYQGPEDFGICSLNGNGLPIVCASLRKLKFPWSRKHPLI